MIILLKPDVTLDGPEIEQILRALRAYPGVTTRTHAERGQTRSVIEVHVIGNTAAIPKEPLEELPGVQQVVRVSDRYRLIGRHKGQVESLGFEYNGVRFDQESLHVFAGLCAVDSRENTEQTMRALHEAGVVTTRMGAYKPRTSPYDFQGLRARVPTLRVRSRRQVRHPRHRHGGDPRAADRGDPLGVARRRRSDRRDAADRHAKRAELRASQGRWTANGVSRALQARHGDHARGIVQRLRVRGERRQPPDRVLPARRENQPRRSAP